MSVVHLQCPTVTLSTIAHGLLNRQHRDGEPYLTASTPRPGSVPCPTTGRALTISSIDGDSRAFCAGCRAPGQGAFISFVNDLRMAYACPKCDQLVWSNGL